MTSPQMREALGNRLAEDAEFRKSFLENPRSALESLTGQPVPAHVTVTANQTASGIEVEFTHDPDADLSDEELAVAAGGVNLPSIDYGAGVIYYDNNRNGRYDPGSDSLIRHV